MAHVSVTAGWPISNQAAPRMLTNGVASVEPVTSAVRGTSGLSISVGDVTHSGDEIWYGTSSSGSLASRDTGSSYWINVSMQGGADRRGLSRSVQLIAYWASLEGLLERWTDSNADLMVSVAPWWELPWRSRARRPVRLI